MLSPVAPPVVGPLGQYAINTGRRKFGLPHLASTGHEMAIIRKSGRLCIPLCPNPRSEQVAPVATSQTGSFLSSRPMPGLRPSLPLGEYATRTRTLSGLTGPLCIETSARKRRQYASTPASAKPRKSKPIRIIHFPPGRRRGSAFRIGRILRVHGSHLSTKRETKESGRH